MKFEYNILPPHMYDDAYMPMNILADRLDTLGGAGWELAGTLPDGTLIFKREKSDAADPSANAS